MNRSDAHPDGSPTMVGRALKDAEKRAKLTLIRAIAREVESWGKDNGYQTRAAVRCGTTRAQMCRILAKQADHFGLTVLFRIAFRAGVNPVVTITRPTDH